MLDEDQAPREEVLEALPIFPLPNAVLLPGMVLPLNVFEPRYLDLVDHVLERSDRGGWIGVPLLRPGYEDLALRGDGERAPAVEQVCGVGRLLSHQALPDGRRFIRLEGMRRVRCVQELPRTLRFRRVRTELLPEDRPRDDIQFEVLKAQLERISSTLRPDDRQLVHSILRIPDDRVMIYAVAAIVPTLGVLPDVPVDTGRSPLLDMQQRCLDAETADERVHDLLECSAAICDVLSDTGRFPRTVMN
jgi:Lon protease-like protein